MRSGLGESRERTQKEVATVWAFPNPIFHVLKKDYNQAEKRDSKHI